MNFYKHHLGDYAAATAHLSWDEDCAYRRLLDAYYKREAPIPADIKDACRLARASTPAQRRAVDTVLHEFFKLETDGWHQKRCDEEIGAASAQAETNRRIAEEREAKRRARIQHESSTRSLNESSTNRSPVSSGEREPSQTPDSTSQTPEEKNPPAEGKARKRATAPERPEDVAEQVWTDWLQHRAKKRATVSPTVIAEARTEAQKAGISLERFLQVWCARGTQGLQADWLRSDERAPVNGSHAPGFVSKQQQIEEHNRRVGEEWLRNEEERDATH